MRGPARILLGTLLLALAGVGLAPAPAGAASGYCTGAGVDVVVDFGALGGGVQKYCATGSGSRSAKSAFDAVGVGLTYVSRFPGAVCRVEGKPAGAGCSNMPPADAYWGLFWSHGSGWTFSSQGVGSLRVSSGDTVAFAWQASQGTRRPSTSPAPHLAAPTKPAAPSSAPTRSGGGHGGTHGGTHAGSSTSPSASASTPGSPGATPSRRAHRPKPTATPSALASASTDAAPSAGASSAGAATAPTRTESATSDDDGGLPWWVPVVVVLVLAAGGGAAVVVRRRSAS